MEVDPPTYAVILVATGPRRLAVMAAVRELRPDLSLAAAKALVDQPPQLILPEVGHYELDRVMNRLRDSGGIFQHRRKYAD